MDGLQFAQLAETKCGQRADAFRSKMNLGKNTSWAAAFISCCAKEANVLDVLIPKSTQCQSIADKGVTDSITHKGTWVPGPVEGYEVTPEPGDIVLISWSSNPSKRADSAGVVKSYDSVNDSIEVVIGDYGTKGSNASTVRMVSYTSNFKCIKGYFRPSWNEVY